MKNKLGFLGLLGLLGIAGFFSDNKAYFALFAFFYFLRFFFVMPDELFKANIQKSATPAFFVGVAIYALTVSLTAFHVSPIVFAAGLVLGFVIPFFIFTISLGVYEIQEGRNK